MLYGSVVIPISMLFLDFYSLKDFFYDDNRTQFYSYKAILVNYIQICIQIYELHSIGLSWNYYFALIPFFNFFLYCNFIGDIFVYEFKKEARNIEDPTKVKSLL